MQAAVARLIADVMKRPDNPTNIVYGVVFSIFHVLQFIPSFYRPHQASLLWLVLVIIQMMNSFQKFLLACTHMILSINMAYLIYRGTPNIREGPV